MLSSIIDAFKVPELRKKILFTLAILALYRFGAYVPVPGIPFHEFATAFQDTGVAMTMLDLFTGGALSNFSVFSLGIMPYISASIIMQMLGIVSPAIDALKKEGEAGRRKMTQYTRYGTLVLAAFQGLGIAVALESQPGLVIDPGMAFRFTAVVTLVTGTMFLMWLGEQITERGLGNGISIIIFAGIVAGLPSAASGLFQLVSTGAISPLAAIFVIAVVVVVTAFVVFIERKMYKDTDALLKKLKLQINSHAKLGSLSIAQMQMVEIAKAVSANCKVLILDEPTSSLTANEVESLFRIMRELKEQGVALVYISHKMDEIKVIADEVTIMRDGHYIGKWNVAEMTKEQIIAKMVGRELSNLFPPLENHPSEEVMMKVEDFTSIHPRSFRHCSFELKKGEILGVAGLVGAQRTELMEGIFGLRAHTSGKVWIKGEEVNIKQPRDAIQKSVALLTEDRRATGILGVLSVADNISIASLDALRKGPVGMKNRMSKPARFKNAVRIASSSEITFSPGLI